MSMDYLTPESDEVKQAFVRLGQIERALCRAAENYVPPIREERYLTGRDVCDYCISLPGRSKLCAIPGKSPTRLSATGYSSIPKRG